MTKVQHLKAKAEEFAARAAAARLRTQRNTFLSLERSCRSLAERAEARDAETPDEPSGRLLPFARA